MPNINLRLTEDEHAELREWAQGSRRSIQREIVFRLFDGAVTEGGAGRLKRTAEVGRSVASPPSVTAAVQPQVHDVPMRAHFRKDRPALQCPRLVPGGQTCPDCGKVVV